MRGPRPTVLAPAFAAISGFLGGKAALGSGHNGNFPLSAVGRRGLCQQLAQGRAAALVAEQHKVILVKGAAHGPEVRQRQGHIRQNAPAALLGGFRCNAVVALVLLLLFFLGAATQYRLKKGIKWAAPSSTPCLMICSSLSCLG